MPTNETEPYTVTDYPNKTAFMDAVRFGVRILCHERSISSNTRSTVVLNPDQKGSFGARRLAAGDSIVVTPKDRKWFARVTRSIADDGYKVE